MAQTSKKQSESEEKLARVAHEIMIAAGHCALITIDSTGRPNARVMDPFPPEKGSVVWLATNPKTRKVKDIKRDPRVTLFYFDKAGMGYVTLIGQAELVQDAKEKERRWKEEWRTFYPNRSKDYLLIRVIPEKMEVVSVKHNIVGDSQTWTTPTLNFNSQK